MLTHGGTLNLDRCPYCNVNRPNMNVLWGPQVTQSDRGDDRRTWGLYVCKGCGGVVLAVAIGDKANKIDSVVPSTHEVAEEVPSRAQTYLHQALESLHAPDGATMLASSAVDAMLKAKGYTEGNLYGRINKAVEDHVITTDMGLWAHQVRLEANDPRHADAERPHVTEQDARQTVNFAMALANFLFVLPSRVTRGLRAAGGTPSEEGGALPPEED